jgi:hypothetical protein
MRHCTSCFRFHAGTPTFCSHCGHSFGVRICSRGHANHRTATYCTECGSADLSTPSPPASLLVHLSGLALYGLAIVAVCAAVLAFIVAVMQNVPAEAVAGPLIGLLLMLGLLYWVTSMLPGPIKKVGKAAGHALWRGMTGKRNGH